MCLYLHGPLPFAVGAVTWTRELLLHSMLGIHGLTQISACIAAKC